MNVNFGLLRIISIISVIIFSAPIFAQTLSGVVQGKIDVKQVRVSTSSSPQLKKVSKRGYFSFRKVDLEKDTFFFYENENALPYYFTLGGMDDIEVDVKDSLITGTMKKRLPEIPTVYGGVIVKQEELKATGEMTALEAVNRKYQSHGATTFLGSSLPIYFLDGVETTNVTGIPIMEIAYVEVVLSSNPACAALGMRGGNGIVLFTTQANYEASLSKEYLEPARVINLIRKE